jgi:hypothetical protein
MKHLSKTLRVARVISIFLFIITLFWAWLGVFTFFNRIYLLRNKNGFRKTQFIVESVEYHPDIGGENSDESYWANSTIDGSKEQLSLKGLLKKKPQSVKDIQAEVPVGTVYSVLYNPSLTDIIIQGEMLRVRLYKEDFWERESRLIWKLAGIMFLPFAAALLLMILILLVIRKQKKDIGAVEPESDDHQQNESISQEELARIISLAANSVTLNYPWRIIVVRVEDLIALGYTEDEKGFRQFENKWGIPCLFAAAVFLAAAVLMIAKKIPIAIGVPAFLCSLLFIAVMIVFKYNSQPDSRHSGRPMLKFKNADPEKFGLIYVCPHSKTYFTQVFMEPGKRVGRHS